MKKIFFAGAMMGVLLAGCGGQSVPLSSSRLETIRNESADIANSEWQQEFANMRWTQCQTSATEAERLWDVLASIEAEITSRKNSGSSGLSVFGQPDIADYQVEFARTLGARDGIVKHFQALNCKQFPDFQETVFVEYSPQG